MQAKVSLLSKNNVYLGEEILTS